MAVHISLLAPSLAITPNGLVRAEMTFDVPGQRFPADGWEDFPVPILGWWLHELSALWNGSSLEAELRFMNGPFYVLVTLPEDGGKWLFTGVEDGLEERTTPMGAADRSEFMTNIISAVDAVGEFCQQNAMTSSDTEAVQSEGRLARSWARMGGRS
jgi:hypothetical protein